MDFIDKILDLLNDMDDSDNIKMWNTFCDLTCRYEDKVFYMSDFEDIFSNEKITFDLVSALANLCRDDKYFTWFRYEEGHEIKSFCNPYEVINLLVLAEYIENHEEDFGFDRIKTLIVEN